MLVSGGEVVPSIDLGPSRWKLCHPSDVLSWYTQEIVFAGAHQRNLLCKVHGQSVLDVWIAESKTLLSTVFSLWWLVFLLVTWLNNIFWCSFQPIIYPCRHTLMKAHKRRPDACINVTAGHSTRAATVCILENVQCYNTKSRNSKSLMNMDWCTWCSII